MVYRPQNDPLIHDDNAPQLVLNPVTQRGSSSKTKRLDDLASELGSDAQSIRDNEGEAAEHGIFYDDTEYDYMQHLRDLNSSSGEAVWVEASTASPDKKHKGKSLEVALREMELQDKSEALLGKDILPSQSLQHLTYQSQQDVPDSIAGFQPDMDPRLREVLEALDDDAYVDDDDDIFQELASDAREVSHEEFEDAYFDDDEDGWESDRTAKPDKEDRDDPAPADAPLPTPGQSAQDTPDEGVLAQTDEWMEDFKRFKKDQKAPPKLRDAAAPSELQSSIWTTTTNGARKKKRKGALTNPSTYSMSSSVLSRTEQLQLLDARFEKIREHYDGDLEDDDLASVSAISTASSVQGPLRSDFDGVLDEFLGNYTKPGKRISKKTKAQGGLDQLEEIRRSLGPARVGITK